LLGLNKPPAIDAVSIIKDLVQLYKQAKSEKNYAQVDHLRQLLKKQSILIADHKNDIKWFYS
ncbi:MAG: cysteine--tRNA ligase, partial [Bacteroidota bacterium]